MLPLELKSKFAREITQGEEKMQIKNHSADSQRNMVLLGVGRLISDLGTWTFRFSLSLYILDVTGSAALFGVIFGLTTLPGVLVNVFAGVLADKFNRKVIIVLSDLLSGLGVLLLSFLFVEGDPNIILFSAYAILISLFQAFFQITLTASVPNVVEERYIGSANAIIQGVAGAVNVLGPIIGALLYAKVGLLNVFVIDGVSFIFSAFIQLFITFKVIDKSTQEEGFWLKFKNSIDYVRAFAGLKVGIVVMCVINFLIGPIIVMGVTYIAYEVFKLSEEQTGIIQASYFAGTMLTAALISIFRLAEKLSGQIFTIIKITAFAFVPWLILDASSYLSSSSSLTILVLSSSMALLGMLVMSINIPIFTTLQIKIPDEKRGSVFGLLSTGTSAAVPVGIWLFGVLFEYVHWSYIIAICIVFIFMTALLSQRDKDLKRLVQFDLIPDE